MLETEPLPKDHPKNYVLDRCPRAVCERRWGRYKVFVRHIDSWGVTILGRGNTAVAAWRDAMSRV